MEGVRKSRGISRHAERGEASLIHLADDGGIEEYSAAHEAGAPPEADVGLPAWPGFGGGSDAEEEVAEGSGSGSGRGQG